MRKPIKPRHTGGLSKRERQANNRRAMAAVFVAAGTTPRRG